MKKGVIANSFPKSGTHILTQLLSLLGYKEANTHLSRSLLVYGPRNLIRNARIYQRIERGPEAGINIDLENPGRRIKTNWLTNHINEVLAANTFCQAHLPFSENLDHVIHEQGIKMLYIHRHPTDVLVSLKNYIINKKNHPNHVQLLKCQNDSERYKMLINGIDHRNNAQRLAPFFDKYYRSTAWSKSKNVCSMTFEEFVGKKGGGDYGMQRKTLERVLNYLGENESDIEEIQSKIYNPKSATFHRGKIGSWRSEMTSDILSLCTQRMKNASIDLNEYYFHT